MARLVVTPRISIDESALSERFIAASGPGGQNVNKVATAVQLRFDAAGSAELSEAVRCRLLRLAGHRATADGAVVITAQRFRTQDRNRADARARLVALIAEAAVAPVFRVKTRPTLGSKRRRLDDKAARAGIKQGRARPQGD